MAIQVLLNLPFICVELAFSSAPPLSSAHSPVCLFINPFFFPPASDREMRQGSYPDLKERNRFLSSPPSPKRPPISVRFASFPLMKQRLFSPSRFFLALFFYIDPKHLEPPFAWAVGDYL